MSSKKRVLDALNHIQPDRIPVDFGSHPCSGMHVSTVTALREYYGLDRHPVKVIEPFQMLGEMEEDLKQVLGIDVDGVSGRTTMFGFENTGWKEWRLDSGLEVLVPRDFVTTEDADGSHYIYPCGDTTAPASGKLPRDGYYFDALVRQEEFDEDELNVEDNLEEFGYTSDKVLAEFAEDLTKVQGSGRAVTVNFGGTALGDIAQVPAVNLKHPKGIRDMEEWYISTVIRQDYVAEIFDRQTEIALVNLQKLNAIAGDKIDVIFICGTDFGTQSSTFCSTDTFRSLYMPYYQRVNNWIHENTKWKTLKHSCGAIEPFIPLLIEAGFDILNPVQCSAVGMDPKHIKQKYGRDIVFWGGGVDTQKLLPFGTPEQVREQVKERCAIFGEGGGYVFNGIHNIQANTPVENLAAMFEVLRSL